MLRISLPIGKRVYIHSTGIGKAILAFLPDKMIDTIIREKGLPGFTKNTSTNARELKKEILLIQQCGYAFDNEENETGIRCVAAPIFDYLDRVIASISISGPAIRINDNRIDALAKMVLETSNEISTTLGHRPRTHSFKT
jgi:DNA-binding IclR family transcriptional regulator